MSACQVIIKCESAKPPISLFSCSALSSLFSRLRLGVGLGSGLVLIEHFCTSLSFALSYCIRFHTLLHDECR